MIESTCQKTRTGAFGFFGFGYEFLCIGDCIVYINLWKGTWSLQSYYDHAGTM